MAYEYKNFASLPVNLNRQQYGALDVSEVFKSESDLNYYLSKGTEKTGVSEYWLNIVPYPYAGQIVSLVKDNGTTTAYILKEVDSTFIADELGAGGSGGGASNLINGEQTGSVKLKDASNTIVIEIGDPGGHYSTVLGQSNTEKGKCDIIAGKNNTNARAGSYSIVGGNGNSNTKGGCVVAGYNNVNEAAKSAVFGGDSVNGVSANKNYSAYSLISGTGNTNGSADTGHDTGTGQYAAVHGIENTNLGDAAIVSGGSNFNSSPGRYSIVSGFENENSAHSSIVGGVRNDNNGQCALVMGSDNTNFGDTAIVSGNSNCVFSNNSIMTGAYCVSNNEHNISIGSGAAPLKIYAITEDPSGYSIKIGDTPSYQNYNAMRYDLNHIVLVSKSTGFAKAYAIDNANVTKSSDVWYVNVPIKGMTAAEYEYISEGDLVYTSGMLGIWSMSVGYSNIVEGPGSATIGFINHSKYDYSVLAGIGLVGTNNYQLLAGSYNSIADSKNKLFVVGNGSSFQSDGSLVDAVRSNAFAIDTNGGIHNKAFEADGETVKKATRAAEADVAKTTIVTENVTAINGVPTSQIFEANGKTVIEANRALNLSSGRDMVDDVVPTDLFYTKQYSDSRSRFVGAKYAECSSDGRYLAARAVSLYFNDVKYTGDLIRCSTHGSLAFLYIASNLAFEDGVTTQSIKLSGATSVISRDTIVKKVAMENNSGNASNTMTVTMNKGSDTLILARDGLDYFGTTKTIESVALVFEFETE